ncbi:MAG: ammonium transporter [Limnothrix sp. RL_2_0]|nr:ammonium transporter [Limnothrix sp. RL_2_0]
MIDIQWLLLCSGLVFLMQPGFMCLESGLTRSKNNINVALKNLIDFGLSVTLFWLLGFGLMFGPSVAGLFGWGDFLINADQTPLLAALFLFQVMFCSTSSTIVSGAVAERLRFEGYVLIVIMSSGLIYPLFGHWVWNGTFDGGHQGWLESLGYVDFAGSSVVHGVGAGISLAAVIVLGARQGRFDAEGRSHKIQGSNIPLSMLGLLLLWLGWLGFNAGSTLLLDDQVPLIMVHTIFGGVGGMLMSCLLSWRRYRLPEVESLMNGTLAGLVGITAGCHALTTSQSFLVGAIAAIVNMATADYLEQRQIDDAVGAIPVHGGAGLWGVVAVAIFGDPVILGTGLNRLSQLMVQLLGGGVCILWSFGFVLLVLKAVNRVVPLRVSAEEEMLGLNVSEHQAKNEFYDLSLAIANQTATQDLSARVFVEPFTEAGLIAQQYNRLIAALSQSTTDLQSTNQELAIAKDKAEAANIAKSQFLTSMSHELRTPLNGILGIAQILENSPNIDIQEQANVDLIYQSGSHLLELINDILDLSKIEAGKLEMMPQVFDVPEFLQEIINITQPQAESKNLTFTTEFDPRLPKKAIADPIRLKQILLNLLSNAIKFTTAGGVHFTARTHSHKDSGQQPSAQIHFAVHDTGVGIEQASLEKLFNPFEQVGDHAQNAKGTGLGLSIRKTLLEQMGSKIHVTSRPNIGSCFSFQIEIPTVVKATPTAQTDAEQAQELKPGVKIR